MQDPSGLAAMTRKPTKFERELLGELEALGAVRTTLHMPVYEFLRNRRSGYIVDEEQVGQGLLTLMVWTSANKLGKSSRRLEVATYVLLALTVALIVLTSLLFTR